LLPNGAKFYKGACRSNIQRNKRQKNYRILFSAHGLPERMIDSGDPYQWQVERTVEEVVELLKKNNSETPDYKVTYQSKVGRLKWIKPSTKDEIILAKKQKKELIIVPIAFVSENSETLVELDTEYKTENENYTRIPAIGINDFFIKSLTDIVIKASKQKGSFLSSSDMSRACPSDYEKCPCNKTA
jgi:protoporphyrin/coproporphyrin ferrochelatase